MRRRVVRLWKIPARGILEMGRLTLLPWTALMAGTPEEITESWRRLVANNDRSLAAQMVLLRRLRYGKKEIFEEGLAKMTTEEILKDSSVYQWIFGEGEKAGVEKSERAGVQHMLRQQLIIRFGQLPPWAAERIGAADLATLDRWGVRVLSVTSLEDCFR